MTPKIMYRFVTYAERFSIKKLLFLISVLIFVMAVVVNLALFDRADGITMLPIGAVFIIAHIIWIRIIYRDFNKISHFDFNVY